MSDEPAITDAYALKRGEVYALRVNAKWLTVDQAAAIRDKFAAHGIDVIVLGSDLELVAANVLPTEESAS